MNQHPTGKDKDMEGDLEITSRLFIEKTSFLIYSLEFSLMERIMALILESSALCSSRDSRSWTAAKRRSLAWAVGFLKASAGNSEMTGRKTPDANQSFFACCFGNTI